MREGSRVFVDCRAWRVPLALPEFPVTEGRLAQSGLKASLDGMADLEPLEVQEVVVCFVVHTRDESFHPVKSNI